MTLSRVALCSTVALVLGGSVAAVAPVARAQGSPFAVSVDSILATAKDLTGVRGGGPPSRYGPLPGTDYYVQYLRDRLADALRPLGGTVQLHTFAPDFEPEGTEPYRQTYANVVGLVKGNLGAESPGAFLLGAHFDATGANTPDWDRWNDPAPGADDNASGVSVLLEVARVLAARDLRPDVDLYVVFFDGEEQQLMGGEDVSLAGSRRLSRADLGRLYGMVNLDMVSYNPRRDSLVVITNLPSRWVANSLLRARANGAAPGLLLHRVVKGLINSDHAPFWEVGVDAVMLIESESIPVHQPNYHRVTDTVANNFSRGGSQAVKAAELILGLVASWQVPSPDSLVVSDDDVLFQQRTPAGTVVDAAVVSPGDSVDVVVGVTNQGGTGHNTIWEIEVVLETLDGRWIRSLGTQTGQGLFPAGTREKLSFPWVPSSSEVGGVRARARLQDASRPGERVGLRTVTVEGAEEQLVRAYVYPNPTTSPRDAVLHYELARGGAVRVSILDVRATRIGEADFSYDSVLPGPEVDVGAADIPLHRILGDGDLAPGLYFVRVELFRNETESADVAISKFAVLR